MARLITDLKSHPEISQNAIRNFTKSRDVATGSQEGSQKSRRKPKTNTWIIGHVRHHASLHYHRVSGTAIQRCRHRHPPLRALLKTDCQVSRPFSEVAKVSSLSEKVHFNLVEHREVGPKQIRLSKMLWKSAHLAIVVQ